MDLPVGIARERKENELTNGSEAIRNEQKARLPDSCNCFG
jgi:hypothetical protein